MRSYVARSSSRNSRPSPARSLSYQWYAAAASRSARGSATSRYSVTDRDSPGDRVRREEAARNGAALIAFPETYIPAFPLWSAVAAPIHNHEWFKRLAASALRCPGPELERIAGAARRHGVVVSLGFNEGTADSVGCLWNSNVLIGEDGAILNHHRKLVPTFWEKLTWANGDGAGLRVCETPLGRIGMLICGENTNPLARFALMAQGEQVHVSTYPPVWPTRDPKGGGNYDLPSAIRIRAGAHSFEAKAFNIVASGFMDAAMREELATLGKDAMRVLDER